MEMLVNIFVVPLLCILVIIFIGTIIYIAVQKYRTIKVDREIKKTEKLIQRIDTDIENLKREYEEIYKEKFNEEYKPIEDESSE